MKHTPFALALSCCATAALAGGMAATAIAAPQVTPAAASAMLQKFVGSGTCTGRTMSHDMKSTHATTGRFVSQKIMDGNWVMIRYDEDQSAAAPKPYHVVQYIGYDAPGKRLTAVTIDNSGSGYSTGTSAGWKGNSITFDESIDGKPASFRDTFTASGSGMSGHMGTMRDKGGKWIKTDEESCKGS